MRRKEKSEALYRRGLEVLVEGVSSASRGPATFGGAPPYMTHGQGSRLYDADGNEYIDWMMAFGALPLGHAHPVIAETIAREAALVLRPQSVHDEGVGASAALLVRFPAALLGVFAE